MPSLNPEAILTAFQEEGWPRRILDSLPPQGDIASKCRLRDTIKSLKRGELLKGHCMADHIYLGLSLPPKCSVAHMIGFLKGKSAVRIHRELRHERRMTGLHFWAAGYCVTTVGLDEGGRR